jgi:Flagella basal body rod protein
MAITDIPILSMRRTRMQWAQERQRVLAENVANADTPNYRALDLAPAKFETQPQLAGAPLTTVSLVRTESGHLTGIGQSDSPFRSKSDGDYEVRPKCREPGARDDESGREPDGLPGRDRALYPQSRSNRNRARQGLTFRRAFQ